MSLFVISLFLFPYSIPKISCVNADMLAQRVLAANLTVFILHCFICSQRQHYRLRKRWVAEYGKRWSVSSVDNALSSCSRAVYLFLWQDNGSVTYWQDSWSLTIQLRVRIHIHCLLTDCQCCPVCPTVTVSGDCLVWLPVRVTMHLPADTFAIKSGECCYC